MLRSSEIMGNPIITYDSGEQIGKVEDLVFDAVNLIALVVNRKNSQVIYMDRIKTIGPDAVIVNSADAIVQSEEVFERQAATMGLKMMTNDAHELGYVWDICFERDGRVAGYDLSGSKLAAFVEGRSFVPAYLVERIGKEVILTSAEAEQAMQTQPSPVKTAVQSVGSTVQKVGRIATDKLGDAANTLTDKLKEAREMAREKVETVQQTASQRLHKVEVVAEEKADEVKEKRDEMIEEAVEAASERSRQLYEAIEKKRNEMNQPEVPEA